MLSKAQSALNLNKKDESVPFKAGAKVSYINPESGTNASKIVTKVTPTTSGQRLHESASQPTKERHSESNASATDKVRALSHFY